jgi:hypothetical protein
MRRLRVFGKHWAVSRGLQDLTVQQLAGIFCLVAAAFYAQQNIAPR